MNLRAALLAPLFLSLAGCSVVRMNRVRDDWPTAYAEKVKRLTVVVQPPPAGQQRAGEAWSRIVRRYVNMKRNFLVRAELVRAALVELAEVCVDGTEGMLWLKPVLTPRGDFATFESNGMRSAKFWILLQDVKGKLKPVARLPM